MSEKKLRIVKPYDPAWTGPFVYMSQDRAINCVVHSAVKGIAFVTDEDTPQPFTTDISNIRCAEEIREPREWWINEYRGHGLSIYTSQKEAQMHNVCLIRTIHVREVLEGE